MCSLNMVVMAITWLHWYMAEVVVKIVQHLTIDIVSFPPEGVYYYAIFKSEAPNFSTTTSFSVIVFSSRLKHFSICIFYQLKPTVVGSRMNFLQFPVEVPE